MEASEQGSLEDIVFLIEQGDVVDVLAHPNQGRDAGQRIIVVQVESYAYMVPCEHGGKTVALKTIPP